LTFELLPTTEEGRHFVMLAEKHAADFALRAEKHDREGSFPFENFEELRKSGFLSGGVPRDFGGLGVSSIYEIMVAMSRLARGDASTAIASNMHVVGAAAIVRFLHRSRVTGDEKAAAVLEELLKQVGSGKVMMCFPTSEPGTDLTSPMTEAVPKQGGYVLNGRKIFGTTSPVAHLFFPTVRVPNANGGYLIATAMVQRTTPGLEVKNNWDAMGMRASGSNDIVFSNCFIPEGQIFGVRDNYGKIGRGFIDFGIYANLPLISTFVGIAEAARNFTVTTMTSQRKGAKRKLLAERIPIQQLVAEIECDLAVSRAMTERVGRAADAFLQKYSTSIEVTVEETDALMKELQCMKYVVNRKVIDIVDKAMTVCGGASYMSNHLLSRLYRDARAGPFMQPFSPYEALEYIGKLTLGLEPNLDR
jgi:alkylation response protein AidB-like acyl-CoA dehydrogenase